MKVKEFYQHYADRLAALVDGPEGYDLGEEKRNEAIIELINSLPNEVYSRAGFFSGFDKEAYDRAIMKEIFEGGDPDGLFETVVEDRANDHWEHRNRVMREKLEQATMLLYYAKDLNSDAGRKANQMMKEGADIANRIGLKLSDHRFQVLVSDPVAASHLQRSCQREVDENRDDYVTVDIRLRSNEELGSRVEGKKAVRLDFFGDRSELLKMMAHVISEDIECEVAPGSIERVQAKVPGFIDGESYRVREGNREKVALKEERRATAEFTP